MLRSIARGTIGAVIGAIAGLITVISMGVVAWDAVVGPTGAIIAAIVGAVVGGLVRGFGDLPVRSLAGGIGGAVAGFFAVAAAEQCAPGSADWAIQGGLMGAGCGVFVAAIAGAVVGLLLFLVRKMTDAGRRV